MSLIILSSYQGYNAEAAHNIENANSFTNYFTNTFVVEPDSEVALISVNCSRKTGQGKGDEGYVRLNGFGLFQTYNGATSQQSKIIGAFLRDTDVGGHSGPIFTQKSHPIYLALRNPEEIHLNQLSVDLVDADEVLVQDLDLDSPSRVVLHVRKRRK